jgi:hypothetical protein
MLGHFVMVDVDADGKRNFVLAAQQLVVAPDASLDIEQLAFGLWPALNGLRQKRRVTSV